jgi:hypothetical protein
MEKLFFQFFFFSSSMAAQGPPGSPGLLRISVRVLASRELPPMADDSPVLLECFLFRSLGSHSPCLGMSVTQQLLVEKA